MPQYSDEEYWQLVFPTFDPKSELLPEDALACTGADVLDGPMFQGTEPRPIDQSSILYANGSNRIRILWFRTHQTADGTDAGALTLLRLQEGFAEVYAVGSYRGSRARTRLGLERMGRELVVTAFDDGCKGRKPGADCESLLSLYVPLAGSLDLLARIAVERVRHAQNAEPGMGGEVEYSLLSALKYDKGGVRILEQVVARAEDGRELRKAERERRLNYEQGKLVPSDESIWQRVFIVANGAPARGEKSRAAPEE